MTDKLKAFWKKLWHTHNWDYRLVKGQYMRICKECKWEEIDEEGDS